MSGSSTDPKSVNFPLYATQGGGYARYVDGQYVWHETPNDRCFADMQVGDPIPEEWGVVSANEPARQEIADEEEQRYDNADLDLGN